MKKIIIIGASGHGKVVADIAEKCGYTNIRFLDDNMEIKSCGGYPVVGDSGRIKDVDGDVIVAVGDSTVRKRIEERIEEKRLAVLIHPDATIAKNVTIGKGTVIMAGTVINPGSAIGRGCIINTCASVDHDCKLGDYVHVAVGSHLAGSVEIGDGTWIGAGAVINNNVTICKSCMIGSGTVVIRDIKEPGTYVGIPARVI